MICSFAVANTNRPQSTVYIQHIVCFMQTDSMKICVHSFDHREIDAQSRLKFSKFLWFQCFFHSDCWFVFQRIEATQRAFYSNVIILAPCQFHSMVHECFHTSSMRYCFLGISGHLPFYYIAVCTCTMYLYTVFAMHSPWNIFSVRIWMRLPIIIGILAVQICCCCYCFCCACACEMVLNDCYCIELPHTTTLCYLIKHYTLLMATYLSEHN